jgi:hypothetical protein
MCRELYLQTREEVAVMLLFTLSNMRVLLELSSGLDSEEPLS